MVIEIWIYFIEDRCFVFFCIAIEILDIHRFIVKIGLKNRPSISLFTTKLHFQIVN